MICERLEIFRNTKYGQSWPCIGIPNMLICDYTGVKAGNFIEQR